MELPKGYYMTTNTFSGSVKISNSQGSICQITLIGTNKYKVNLCNQIFDSLEDAINYGIQRKVDSLNLHNKAIQQHRLHYGLVV